MPIVLVRIDDRLVHGQVVEGWVPQLGAQEVVVVSDGAAQDETQALLMRMALPESVGLQILRVSEAPARLAVCAGKPEKALVLAPGPQEVLELLKQGVRLERVNVGGLHYSAGRVQLGKAIFLSRADREAILEIGRRGVRVEGRAVPGDAEVDIVALIGSGGPGQP
ncbi:MAG: PTS sugar transporter subunit IIB [Elusimicrobia bacterium]|nr:PTS sugar transporter subunit IIB [Elusimicrobiota bacterium]